MKHSLIKTLCITTLTVILFMNCNQAPSSQNSTTGFTNEADQEYMLLSQEFDKNNFEKIIGFIDSYFKKNRLEEENLKLLLLKTKAKEKLLKKLNNHPNKKTFQQAKKYNFKVKDDRIIYLYDELSSIWKEFPTTTYGKDAFFKHMESTTDLNRKSASYETFIEQVKDPELKNRLQYELSEVYLNNLISFKSKDAEKLNELYIRLKNSEYSDKIIFNALILQYKVTGNRESYKEQLKTFQKIKTFKGVLANYLLGESEFIDNNLSEAKESLLQAKKMFKHVKGSESIPLLIAQLEHHTDNSLNNLKSSIKDKIDLIEKIKRYQDSLTDKKMAFITGERVRVRKDPSISKKNIMTTLNYGDKVTIIRKSDEK
ncbi:MAG: hypothetical protein KKH98_09725, partial [Spirochaetes bacterium]|nr:hypothetical protein [Spirochaetota bacterium]